MNRTRTSSVRIIAGQYRGRTLPVAKVAGLRPTGNRQRERLFNWLQFELGGCWADLYAGSGALGLEALSRGASELWLIEQHPQIARSLQQTLTQWQGNGQVIQQDALGWLQQTPIKPLDGVFIDPPFAANLWQATINALDQGNWLKEGAWVYLEAPVQQSFQLPSGWQLHKKATAGVIQQLLYRCRSAS